MKSKNREINIFNMSALDLFASALGAFLLLAVVALPYFGNTAIMDDEEAAAELQRTREALAQAQAELEACRAELESERTARTQAEAQLEQCRREAQANFLLILMNWGSQDDVDLHVTDPSGNEYYYESRAFSGSPARFEEDNTVGPGNEVWLHPDVSPGVYTIEYVLYGSRSGRAVPVRGAALHNDGRLSFDEVTLPARDGERRLAAKVQVAADGRVTIL